LTDDEKDKYKVFADKYNSTQVKKQPLKQIIDLQNNSRDFWNMQKCLTNMFDCIPNNEGKNYHINLRLSSIHCN